MLNSSDVTALFGKTADSAEVEQLFRTLNTLERPELDRDREAIYHDFVLARRAGVELGFVDSNFQQAGPRELWGRGELLLAQLYLYTAFRDVSTFQGGMPFGASWGESRRSMRQRLEALESSRHSHLSDTWDVSDKFRLTAFYTEREGALSSLFLRQMQDPLAPESIPLVPDLASIAESFGNVISDPEFCAVWREALVHADIAQGEEDGEIDLLQVCGARLGVAPSAAGGILKSVTFHRNRDRGSVGWPGQLPLRLSFEDSPEVLFQRVGITPVQAADGRETGHAVWHFDTFTLHVLYSNIDNRLLRVKMLAPGTWRCVEDE